MTVVVKLDCYAFYVRIHIWLFFLLPWSYQNISSNVLRPLGKAMQASTWWNIAVIRSDIVKTCRSILIIFLMMSTLAKAFGMIPKTWLPPKNTVVDKPRLPPPSLNESFSQLVPDKDDLLFLNTHFLSKDWIHKKQKYFLFYELRNLLFLHTSISVECMGWVEIKGRKKRFIDEKLKMQSYHLYIS